MNLGRLIWGAIVIVIGLLLLGATLGWIPRDFLFFLLRLWPLILVLVGVHLLLGKWLPMLAGGLIALIFVGALVGAWFWWQSGDARANRVAIEGPLTAGVTAARADLNLGAMNVSVYGQSTSRMVVGSYETRGAVRVNHTLANGVYELSIRPTARGWAWLGPDRGEKLELALASGIPWSIKVKAGAIDAELDLDQVLLEKLDLETGASSVTIKIGEVSPHGAQVLLSGGVASYRLALASDLNVTITSDSGLTNLDVEGFDRTADGTFVHEGKGPPVLVTVKTGVSSVKIRLD